MLGKHSASIKGDYDGCIPKPSKRRRLTWKAIACIALAAICAICVCLYCAFPSMFHDMFHGSAHPGSPSATQSSSQANPQTNPQTKADFSSSDIAKLNKAASSMDGNPVSLGEAHPGYTVGSDGALNVQSTRNVEELHNSGTYQLTVFCLGKGSLSIDFSIGAKTRQQTMQCLTGSANQTSVNLDADAADTGTVNSTTIITPATSSKCLIAYRLDYLGA